MLKCSLANSNSVIKYSFRNQVQLNEVCKIKVVFLVEDLGQKIECLKEPFINAWDKVLFFDPSINKKNNNKKILRYGNINYWMGLNKKILEITTII